MTDLIFRDECYKIMGAYFEVYKEKGCGFLESVYQECLALELQLQAIPFDTQRVLPLEYKGRQLNQVYVADFICFDKIVVEPEDSFKARRRASRPSFKLPQCDGP